jgi:hypothetical protein
MKKYRLVAYIRIDPDESTVVGDFRAILAEQEQQALLFPENIYRIEEVDDDAIRQSAGDPDPYLRGVPGRNDPGSGCPHDHSGPGCALLPLELEQPAARLFGRHQ